MAYKNKEDLLAYRKKNRARANEISRLWRLANPGRGAAKSKEWREKNPEKHRAQALRWKAANKDRLAANQREWRQRTNYNSTPKRLAHNRKAELKKLGLTPEDYDALLLSQNKACAICGATTPGRKDAKHLYVDHCHATGRVRGLLCMHCNSMLGKARDSIPALLSAARYLGAP